MLTLVRSGQNCTIVLSGVSSSSVSDDASHSRVLEVTFVRIQVALSCMGVGSGVIP